MMVDVSWGTRTVVFVARRLLLKSQPSHNMSSQHQNHRQNSKARPEEYRLVCMVPENDEATGYRLKLSWPELACSGA
jgi:hypothetical protein